MIGQSQIAAVRPHHVAGDRQPESDAAGLPVSAVFHPVEWLKQAHELRGRNPRAEIAHDDSAFLGGSDDRNLDAVSAQYNLECNVVVDSAEFGAISRASFERDLADSTRLELDTWKRRPVPLRFVAWFAALFRAFM